MKDLLTQLKSEIKGEILADDASLEHYAKDGSIFKVKPWAVVMPAEREDISALVKWASKTKAESGDPKISLTCRGKATDQAGGPLNDGIIVRFPGYLDKVIETGAGFIRVEPGVLWGQVFDAAGKFGEYLPPYPASYKFSTIGGAVANNCGGEKSVKYGSMRDWVQSVKMILADGKEVEFKRYSEKEIETKQTQSDLEGEIYRKMSDLLVSKHNLIQNSRLKVTKSSTGYWLYDLLGEDGSIDLARLIAGSQGTLGVITEITLRTIKKPVQTALLLASYDDLKKAGEAVSRVLALGPSAFELVDSYLIKMITKARPELTESLVKGGASPALVHYIEFEGEEAELKDKIGQARNLIADLAIRLEEAYGKEEQEKLWATRRLAAIIAETAEGEKKALPFIEDSTVPPERLAEYLGGLYEIFKKYGVEFSVWGHAGNANLHVQPFLNLAKPRDDEEVFELAEEVYDLAIRLGGAISGVHNDGIMRTPFLPKQFSEEMMQVFVQVKNIFDPQNIFNPNKKIGAA